MTNPREPERRHVGAVRNCMSSRGDPSVPDHQRRLPIRGRNALSQLGDHNWCFDPRHDVVMSPSSRRTRATPYGISPALDRTVRVESNPALFSAGAEQPVTESRRIDDQIAAAFIAAPNPGVANLVDLLAVAQAIGAPVIDTSPTVAVAVLPVAGRWSALQPAGATLKCVPAPRQLR